MQAWRIIVASAVAASIVAAALFLPAAMQSQIGAVSLFQTHWPGMVIVWLGVYSVATLVISTVTAVRDLRNAEGGPVRPEWPRRYLLRLGVTHYFSAVLVLFALSLLPLTIVTEPAFRIPAATGSSLALATCALAILFGVLGWLTVTIVAAFASPTVWADSPARLDTQMLQEIIELLRARPVAPVTIATELSEQLRQRDRSTLEAIKELAGAVNRVRNGISDIQHGLQPRGPEQTGQSSSAALADIADVAGELRAATAALMAAVAKLDDIAAGLAAFPTTSASLPTRGNLPPGSRSQLSTELQELLRDMATGSATRPESPR